MNMSKVMGLYLSEKNGIWCKSNVSWGNVEMGARGRYIGRRAILSQLPHQRGERGLC